MIHKVNKERAQRRETKRRFELQQKLFKELNAAVLADDQQLADQKAKEAYSNYRKWNPTHELPFLEFCVNNGLLALPETVEALVQGAAAQVGDVPAEEDFPSEITIPETRKLSKLKSV